VELEPSDPKVSANNQTFCIYCQRDFTSPLSLRMHIEKEHKGSYAFFSVNLEWASK
jgi:hypothetical protein